MPLTVQVTLHSKNKWKYLSQVNKKTCLQHKQSLRGLMWHMEDDQSGYASLKMCVLHPNPRILELQKDSCGLMEGVMVMMWAAQFCTATALVFNQEMNPSFRTPSGTKPRVLFPLYYS